MRHYVRNQWTLGWVLRILRAPLDFGRIYLLPKVEFLILHSAPAIPASERKSMRTNVRSESGLFRPRFLLALILASRGLLLGMFSLAVSAPAGAVLSTSDRSITYTDSTGSLPNPSGLALGAPNRTAPMSCSTLNLTIDPTVGLNGAG